MLTTLKVANWNIEWMNHWFTGDSAGAPELRTKIRGVDDVDELAKRVAEVIVRLDAHVITIQEGPSRLSEMALFVKRYLKEDYLVYGPAGKGQQKLFALVRKEANPIQDVVIIHDEHGIDFNDPWEVDVDADMVPDGYHFTRPPLVLGANVDDRDLRIINLHTKSKYVHNGENLWRNPLRQQEFIKLALQARRRISAEAMRVRSYLNRLLEADIDSSIVVAGDFNDGPGMDLFESTYLTHNVAGLIAGSPYAPNKMLRHGFIDLMDAELNYTAIFDDFVEDVDDKKVLLDHIFVSPGLFWNQKGGRAVSGQIEHDIFNSQINKTERGRARMPSDHRPQSIRIEL